MTQGEYFTVYIECQYVNLESENVPIYVDKKTQRDQFCIK